jgi:guanylate cyclase
MPGPLGLADEESDSDDVRLRKHLGVAGGYVAVLAPVPIPFLAYGHPVALVLAASFTAFGIANLVLLARTHRFERYAVALLSATAVFVPITNWAGGGITLTSAGLIWGFIVPAYALMALGPTRAIRWFVVFIGMVVAALALELIHRQPFGPEPPEVQLIGGVINTIGPTTAVFLALLYSDRRRRAAEARSDELLTNAIPASIARRLRRGEGRIADVYPETTVLFADLAGFTPWARGTDPERVAEVLDRLFTRFDRLVAGIGLEKIKTIGDSYMVASGAPEPRADHATAAMALAVQMLEAAAAWRNEEGVGLEIRIGLASGAVAGGVIGQQRILFDLWGDTVNAAARMESTGEPGWVHLTESTRRLLGEDREYAVKEVEVKGLGTMVTYQSR